MIIQSPLVEILTAAERVATRLLAPDSPVLAALEGRQGGYLCATDLEGKLLLLSSVGSPDPGKFKKYIEFCQEKAVRLAGRPQDHRSMTSRDPVRQKWGGAVRGNNYIVSFSGFPEDLDEILAAAVLCLVHDFNDMDIRNLLRRDKGNAFLPESNILWFHGLCSWWS